MTREGGEHLLVSYKTDKYQEFKIHFYIHRYYLFFILQLQFVIIYQEFKIHFYKHRYYLFLILQLQLVIQSVKITYVKKQIFIDSETTALENNSNIY